MSGGKTRNTFTTVSLHNDNMKHPQNIAERAIHDKFQGGDQQLTEWQVSELSLYSLPAPAPTPGPPYMSFNFKTTHHRQVFRLNINVCLSNMKNDELVTQHMLLCYAIGDQSIETC